MERNHRVWHPQESLRGNGCDLKGIALLGLQASQGLLDRSACRFLSFTTERGGSAFSGQVEKGPPRCGGFPIDCISVEPRDRPPPWRKLLTVKRKPAR